MLYSLIAVIWRDRDKVYNFILNLTVESTVTTHVTSIEHSQNESHVARNS